MLFCIIIIIIIIIIISIIVIIIGGQARKGNLKLVAQLHFSYVWGIYWAG